MTLAVQACRESFVGGADSFLLISSDSDYWALIRMLPEARFLVMVEHEKCSFDLKAKLLEQNIYYAYLDDFYSANSLRIKQGVLIGEVQEEIEGALDGLNLKELLARSLKDARMDLSQQEQKNFYEKYMKTLKLEIDADGNMKLVMKK